MSRPFRNRFDQPRLTPEEAGRQGRVSRLAFEKLGEPQAAIAFLNTYAENLAGRPIDVAIASAEGLSNVEAALAVLTSG